MGGQPCLKQQSTWQRFFIPQCVDLKYFGQEPNLLSGPNPPRNLQAALSASSLGQTWPPGYWHRGGPKADTKLGKGSPGPESHLSLSLTSHLSWQYCKSPKGDQQPGMTLWAQHPKEWEPRSQERTKKDDGARLHPQGSRSSGQRPPAQLLLPPLTHFNCPSQRERGWLLGLKDVHQGVGVGGRSVASFAQWPVSFPSR